MDESLRANVISSVRVRGLHGAVDLSVDLRPGLNVLYGRNGSGKTTFLHILANLIEGDVDRFWFLNFAEIDIQTRSGQLVLERTDGPEPRLMLSLNGESLGPIARETHNREQRQKVRAFFGRRPVYLPAFRSVLEAITSQSRTSSSLSLLAQRELQQIGEMEREDGDVQRGDGSAIDGSGAVAHKTALCRDWFGRFVPVVRFPSINEVSRRLASEYQQAELRLALRDREAFSNTFVQVLKAVFEQSADPQPKDAQDVLGSIRQSLESLQGQEQAGSTPSVYGELAEIVQTHFESQTTQEAVGARILGLYETALRNRIHVQREVFQRLRTLQNSINRFLTDKRLTVRRAEARAVTPRVTVQLRDGKNRSLSVLSSGERHVLTLLFSATHMSEGDGALLVDEPELSLHVDWQRIILSELIQQAGERQIIACTHSPEVAADHRSVMIKLEPRPYEPQRQLSF